MSTLIAPPRAHVSPRAEVVAFGTVSRARTLVRRLGGRFSVELGIDVDGGPDEVERSALVSRAAEHAHLPASPEDLEALAVAAHLDLRDLEAALCRLAASHDLAICPGGEECTLVALDPQDYGRA